MSAIGLHKRVTKWVAIFLENRTQRIKVVEALSDPVIIKRGIPQGSIIGPLCFLKGLPGRGGKGVLGSPRRTWVQIPRQ